MTLLRYRVTADTDLVHELSKRLNLFLENRYRIFWRGKFCVLRLRVDSSFVSYYNTPMISILQEVTDWGDQKIANGIYHVDGGGLLVQHNDTVFKEPLKGFRKTGRKFTKIGERPEKKSYTSKVYLGSNGAEYIVDGGMCTCPGFKFRGDCKHLTME